MVLSTLSQANPNDISTQSVNAICSFVNWIESQSIPPCTGNVPYTNAYNALNQMKQDAMQWINQLYPCCTQVLDSIGLMDSQVTSGLNTLTALSDQLQALPDNQALHNSIVTEAKNLGTVLAGLQSSAGTLVKTLSSFNDALGQDFTSLSNSYTGLMNEMHCQQATLSSLYGQLNSLRHKSCPNQGDINACEKNIQNQQSLLDMINKLCNTVEQALNLSSQARQGLSYLLTFWQQIQSETRHCIAVLDCITTDPVTLLKVDISNASQIWSSLRAFTDQTLNQLSQNAR